jgi:hypothetical protein
MTLTDFWEDFHYPVGKASTVHFFRKEDCDEKKVIASGEKGSQVMFTAFVDEIVRAEGASGVLLIDTGSPYLTVYSDKWGCYKGNLLPTT